MTSPDSDPDDPIPPRRSSFLSLPVIFLVGWIMYEVSQQPAVAAMAMCLKFAWEDFRTARWLLKTDPDRQRGRACCWLYIASGLWQTAVIGVAMVLLTVAVAEIVQAQQQGGVAVGDVFKLLYGAALTILFGFIFSTLATYVAMVSAWRHRVRPWLNGAIHIARRNNQWPPLYGHRNRIMILLLTTIVITFAIVVPACFVLGAMILKGFVPMKVLATIGTGIGLLCYVFLLPGSVIFVLNLRRRNFYARHPADCWGNEPRADANNLMDEERDYVKSI